MKDLLIKEYPDFFSASNKYASMQFCLNAVIRNDQLPMLLDLLDGSKNVGGIEGDPGWSIEYRKSIYPAGAYAMWPSWASFRIFLAPEAFEVNFPECYVTEHDFLECANRLLVAYRKATLDLP